MHRLGLFLSVLVFSAIEFNKGKTPELQKRKRSIIAAGLILEPTHDKTCNTIRGTSEAEIKLFIQPGTQLVKKLLNGAVKHWNDPPNELNYVKIGGRIRARREFESIKVRAKTLQTTQGPVTGKLVGDRFITLIHGNEVFPPTLEIYKVRLVAGNREPTLKELLRIEYLDGKGHKKNVLTSPQ